MNNTLAFINSLMKPQEQWPMSSIESEPGMSLPEFHVEPEAVPTVPLSAESEQDPKELATLIAALLKNQPSYSPGQADDISEALEKLLKSKEEEDEEMKAAAMGNIFVGAAMKTVAAADKFFSNVVGLAYGNNLDEKYKAKRQNYINQMNALDNQVMYIKHQLSDRFNQTVENNIMQMAARGLRANAGNVLDLTKDAAGEITEDMRTAESNAELEKIALKAKKKQAKVSTEYAHTKLWTDMAQSAVKLGIMYQTGGGTGISFGNLFAGYQMGNAIKEKSFNELYKGLFEI